MVDQIRVNMIYDCLAKIQLVEMVMKDQGMDLDDIKKVEEALKDQLKRA